MSRRLGTEGSPRTPSGWHPEAGKSRIGLVILGLLVAVAFYGIFQWFFCRIEVDSDEICILIAKTGENLPSGEIIATKEGQKGIQLQHLMPGRHFRNPLFWDWEKKPMTVVESGSVGIQTRLYGEDPDLAMLREGRITFREDEDIKGVVQGYLTEGKYPINTLAYRVDLQPIVQIPAGFVGVVTNLDGVPPKAKNEFLVEEGEKGVLRQPRLPQRVNFNPWETKIELVDVRSQRYELVGDRALRFPSSDGFTITVRMVLEWAVLPDRAPEVVVRIGNLHRDDEKNAILQKVLIPMLRGFGRIEGSKYRAKEYISGETRLTFQNAVFEKLKPNAEKSGISIKSLLVTDIVPPDEIAGPIRDREIAKEELMRNQQQLIQEKLLSVARTDLEAARRQASAILARGGAEATVVRLQRVAEADALRQAVGAFPNGASYAKYEFYKKVAPRMLSVFANTDGPFGEIFEEYARQVGGQ